MRSLALLLVATTASAQPQIATSEDIVRPAKLTKVAPYQLDWGGLPPSFTFARDELLYVDASRGALLAAPIAGGAPRVVYTNKVGYIAPELEAGDALVLIDEPFDHRYTEHYRRVVVATGASTELGRDLPAEQRMIHDSMRFRAAGLDAVQPFRVGNRLGGQTATKDLVVLDGSKVGTVCRSPQRDLAWPQPLGDGRRLAQPAGDQLYLADLTTRTCVHADATAPIYPMLAGTTDGAWVLYAASTTGSLTLYLADAKGHARHIATLPGAIAFHPVALAGHRFVYAVSGPTGTVFEELDADTGISERRTCALGTGPDFQVSPDGHRIAVAVATRTECVSETGIYVIEL